MKAIKAASMLLVVLAALPLALAQVPAVTAAPDAVSADAPRDAATAKARPSRRAWAYADARHCLDRATNPEVIVCAEQYLPQPRRAAGS
jgi:hypothetical protein